MARLHRLSRSTALLTVLLWSFAPPSGAASDETSGGNDLEAVRQVLASETFSRKFDEYRERTSGRGVGPLKAYLESAIEDALLDDSRVSATALTAEIRHFGDAVLAELRAGLCGGVEPEPPAPEELKATVVRSVAAAARQSAVELTHGSYGRMGGIVVNLLGEVELCTTRSLSDLD